MTAGSLLASHPHSQLHQPRFAGRRLLQRTAGRPCQMGVKKSLRMSVRRVGDSKIDRGAAQQGHMPSIYAVGT